jgi:outer membrane protein, heavy metal efflux system
MSSSGHQCIEIVEGMLRATGLVAIAVVCCGCATGRGAPDRATIDTAMRERTKQGIRVNETQATPPGVVVDDGLSSEEAVSIALWNNPAFQVALTDLGFARADLIEASQLRNPVLSLLFPWGPKQFESTLQLPIEAIWQRPRRVKAAALDAAAIAARLMSDGLGVMAQARTTYLDATAAESRVRLAHESAALWGRLRTIADARLREGDISEFEARSVRSEAAMADASARGADGDKEVSRIQLDTMLGHAVPASSMLTPIDELPISQCDSLDALLTDALAARPDVRAAELAVEAAGARIGLEQSKIVTLTAALDANGEGKEGFELGPGLGIDLPFNGNAGARARAAAALAQASQRYLAVQATVRGELRTGVSRMARAREVLRVWDEQVIASLQTERQQAEKAYDAGETPLYAVLDTARRVVAAHRARLDARVELLNAAIALDRAIGRSCAFQ